VMTTLSKAAAEKRLPSSIVTLAKTRGHKRKGRMDVIDVTFL